MLQFFGRRSLLISSSTFAQSKVELHKDTLLINGAAIYKGLKMKISKPDKRVFDFITMGTFIKKTEVLVSMVNNVDFSIISEPKEKKGVFSINIKLLDTRGLGNINMLTITVTDLVKALENKEISF